MLQPTELFYPVLGCEFSHNVRELNSSFFRLAGSQVSIPLEV